LLLILQLWHRYWYYFLQWWRISWLYKKIFHQDIEPSEIQVYTAIFSSLIKKNFRPCLSGLQSVLFSLFFQPEQYFSLTKK
jgi:hypothetical protein